MFLRTGLLINKMYKIYNINVTMYRSFVLNGVNVIILSFQKPATGPHPEPAEPSYTPFQIIDFVSISQLSCMPHALPISYSLI